MELAHFEQSKRIRGNLCGGDGFINRPFMNGITEFVELAPQGAAGVKPRDMQKIATVIVEGIPDKLCQRLTIAISAPHICETARARFFACVRADAETEEMKQCRKIVRSRQRIAAGDDYSFDVRYFWP